VQPIRLWSQAIPRSSSFLTLDGGFGKLMPPFGVHIVDHPVGSETELEEQSQTLSNSN
jgi:hypothetical protein